MQTVTFLAVFVTAVVFVEKIRADDRPNMIFVMTEDRPSSTIPLGPRQ